MNKKINVNSCINFFKMYLLKIKGNGKIPNYIQIRDNQYTLLAYFRLDKLKEGLEKNNLIEHYEMISATLESLDFGVMLHLDIKLS